MTLKEEKKLVADWMGWSVSMEHGLGPMIIKEYPPHLMFHNWHPNSSRFWWDEIWDNMDMKTFKIYMKELKSFHYERPLATKQIFIHTAKSEICWKALVTTLLKMRDK